MKNLKTQGFILIDVDVAALNNAGKSQTTGLDNGVATKKIRKNGRTYPYVSGQAWRYWWRDTLQKHHDWNMSPIIRESKVAYTSADPVTYPDDDVFGYMRAAKVVLPGEKKPTNATVTRVSPLKNSALIAVASTMTEEHWSSMARHDGDAVPYTKEEYSAVMKGMFSLDLAQLGTFSDYDRTGFKNLTAEVKEAALKHGASMVADPHVLDKNHEAQELVRLPLATRIQRAKDTVAALKVLSGGAMQTNNLADVTPKFIVLATTTSGNHPFSHVAVAKGEFKERFALNVEGIQEVIKDYGNQIVGKVYIGYRSGFLDKDEIARLQGLAEQESRVQLGTPNEAIDAYVASLEMVLSDESV